MHRLVAAVAVLLISLGLNSYAASPIKAGWTARAIASAPGESNQLLDKDKQVVAVVSISRVRRLIDTLSRIQNAAGMTSDLILVQLSDTKPNAFASSKDGTNYVLVSLSMLDLLGDDMDAYAFLFGHEIAHHVKQHGAATQNRRGFLQGLSFITSIIIGARTGVNVGGLTDLGANLIDRTYSRDQEREADQLGLSYMVTTGFDPQGAITLQRKLLAASGSTVFPFLSTHPGGEERIANLEKMIQSMPQSTVATASPPTEGGRATDPVAIELGLWDRIKNSQSPTDFQEYLNQYPNGRFADMARDRVRTLGSTQVATARASVEAARPAAIDQEVQNLAVGKVFRDCDGCPDMVVIPAGIYDMGGTRRITLGRQFAVGKTEVTFAQWDVCVSEGGCSHRPDDRGWGRDNQPVMDVSWDDAKQYVAWLSRKTSKSYRLLTEAEWEYAARAGTTTAYYWGDSADGMCRYASVAYVGGVGCGINKTSPVGQRQPNAFGLYDMLGNVWEWVEDCWNSGIEDVPSDGSARTTGECGQRVLRGGSWYDFPHFARSAVRDWVSSVSRNGYYGFRVARTL